MTKGLIEEHNGTLVAESDGLDKGTSFILTLPLYCSRVQTDPLEEVGDSTNPVVRVSENFEQNAMRILIVDDAEMNRKLLGRLLTKAGHICDQAVDGKEACEMVEQSQYRYDTILMDKEMPVCDGPKAVRRLRDGGCDSFIVGVTGSVLPEDLELFTKSGTNHNLPKPFRLEALEELWVEFGIQGSINPNE